VGDFVTAAVSTVDENGNPTADPSDTLTYWLDEGADPATVDGRTISIKPEFPGIQLLHIAVNGIEIGPSPCVPDCNGFSPPLLTLPRRFSFSVTGDLACAPGRTPVDSRCERCANGFFKLDATSAPCSPCVTFVAGSVDTDPVLTPDSVASCICPTGFVLFEDSCVECPEGTDCTRPGVAALTLPLEAGHWRSSESSMEVLQCGEAEACTGNGTDACAEGHRGPLCELCDDGWAKAGGVCVECAGSSSGKTWGALGAAAVVVTVLGMCAYTARHARKKKNPDDEVDEGTGEGLKSKIMLLRLPGKLVLQYARE
jgi:hypothetical protein